MHSREETHYCPSITQMTSRAIWFRIHLFDHVHERLFQEECSMFCRIASVVSYASTSPFLKISRCEHTCSTTSSTCEQ